MQLCLHISYVLLSSLLFHRKGADTQNCLSDHKQQLKGNKQTEGFNTEHVFLAFHFLLNQANISKHYQFYLQLPTSSPLKKTALSTFALF